MYERALRVEFNHCDPAGIVFYPRYFELLNSQVENFFRERLDMPFERITLKEGCGVPTLSWQVQFLAPSRLGELLTFRLDVAALGKSSLDLAHEVRGPSGELRLTAAQRLVWTGSDGRSAPWPEALRAGLAAALSTAPR